MLHPVHDVQKSSFKQRCEIYINIENETVFDNLVDRHNRSKSVYKKEIIPRVLEFLRLPQDTKVHWSKYTGCKMCPCSPGFYINQRVNNMLKQASNVIVTINPVVTESE
jgi:hypothetical protein